MFPPDPNGAANTDAARLLLASLASRTVIGEAVGIVQGWRGCDAAEGLRFLSGDAGGPGAEAARVAAVSDSAAEGRADPDYGGWA